MRRASKAGVGLPPRAGISTDGTVTVDEYAAMCGVSRATIDWMTTDPDDRPLSFDYVPVPPVFTSQAAFAKLWGAGDTAVRYQAQRGIIELHDALQVEVHQADTAWGIAYWDRMVAMTDPRRWRRMDGRVFATIFAQAVERELIRLGHLPPTGLIEAQLGCVARSPEWWRRNRGHGAYHEIRPLAVSPQFRCAVAAPPGK